MTVSVADRFVHIQFGIETAPVCIGKTFFRKKYCTEAVEDEGEDNA